MPKDMRLKGSQGQGTAAVSRERPRLLFWLAACALGDEAAVGPAMEIAVILRQQPASKEGMLGVIVADILSDMQSQRACLLLRKARPGQWRCANCYGAYCSTSALSRTRSASPCTTAQHLWCHAW